MTPAAPNKIALIGAGQMAEALLRGLLASGIASREHLFATDPSEERRSRMTREFEIRTGLDNREAASWSDAVVLAVKPQTVQAVLAELGPVLSGQLVVSIAAGVPIAQLTARLPAGARIARVMPNAPAMVGEGMSAITFGPAVTPQDRELVLGMFSSVGKVAVVEERLMDAVTGLSGSGPAYVFIAIEALADAGVKMGLARPVAEILAARTMLGPRAPFSKPVSTPAASRTGWHRLAAPRSPDCINWSRENFERRSWRRSKPRRCAPKRWAGRVCRRQHAVGGRRGA
jgi:pyrroline-5-carboxylate reductase